MENGKSGISLWGIRSILSLIVVVGFYLLMCIGLIGLMIEGELAASETLAILGLSLSPVSATIGYWFGKKDDTP